ncbi:MAG: hypothetical protein HDR28_12205 [Lachnospiraceae bacterium]|nr:hypothetical protein [Lachnospiraceae bacterium]
MVEEIIQQLFSKYPSSIYGFTSIPYSLYASQYRSALVFAVPYGEQLTIKNYTEERFERGIQDAKRVVDEILVQIEEIPKKLYCKRSPINTKRIQYLSGFQRIYMFALVLQKL